MKSLGMHFQGPRRTPWQAYPFLTGCPHDGAAITWEYSHWGFRRSWVAVQGPPPRPSIRMAGTATDLGSDRRVVQNKLSLNPYPRCSGRIQKTYEPVTVHFLKTLNFSPSFFYHALVQEYYKTFFKMFALPTYMTALALFLAAAATSPLQQRDIQWSFDLFPTPQCNQTGDLHAGMGSTGCRANLHSVASAYRLNTVAEGCHIEFFDNTMCDATETTSDIAGPISSTGFCRVPELTRRYGSYQVTCEEKGELK